MRKILFSTLIVLVCSVGVATAQLQKGSTLVGGGIGNIKFGLGSAANFSVNLTPNVGYFIQDNIAIGAKANLIYSGVKNSDDTFDYSLNGFGRYYFGAQEFDTLLKHGRWFLEAGVGLAGLNNAPLGFNVNFGPGYAYFLNEHVSVEGLLLYDGKFGSGSSNGFSINVGFQIYFPASKYKSMKDNPKSL